MPHGLEAEASQAASGGGEDVVAPGHLVAEAPADPVDRRTQALAAGHARPVREPDRAVVEGVHARALARAVGPAELEGVLLPEQLEARHLLCEAVPQLLAQQQRAGAGRAVGLVVAALERVPRAIELDRVVAGDRPAVESQRGDPQPVAVGRPARDVRVELGRLGLGDDRRTASALPARGLNAKHLLQRPVEPLEALVDVERNDAVGLQLAQTAAQTAPAIARQAALVCPRKCP